MYVPQLARAHTLLEPCAVFQLPDLAFPRLSVGTDTLAAVAICMIFVRCACTVGRVSLANCLACVWSLPEAISFLNSATVSRCASI